MSVPEGLSHASKIYDDKQSLIRLMDSKASTMLVACGILLPACTMVTVSGTNTFTVQFLTACCVVLIALTVLTDIFGVLWPRGGKGAGPELFFPEGDADSFFMTLASSSGDDFLRGYASQVVSLSEIFETKKRYFRCSSVLFLLSVVTLTALVFAHILA
ncbi:MAG: hypothetical protein FWH47_00260 [Methanomassiliicoccaceae archaeon]|nr:hypothetical protein [Methanomassiliicoccaceae archaeon]